jgi:hypothetical protein
MALADKAAHGHGGIVADEIDGVFGWHKLRRH